MDISSKATADPDDPCYWWQKEVDELRAENERLRAHVEGAEAVIGLGKAWWLARGHSRAVAEAEFEKAVAAYDPATWQT